jgi:hypothetical protein
MTSSLAAVILVHDNPSHVRRLIGALSGLQLFLHCDSKTPDAVLAAMVEGAADVRLVPRHRTARAQWGMVEGEIAGVRASTTARPSTSSSARAAAIRWSA